MKKMKKLIALILALAMVLALAACSGEPSGSGETAPEATTEAVQQAAYTVEELGSGNPKWTEEVTADGWVKVTNEGGDTLGYSKDSGVTLIQVDGFAFKDLDRDGELDVYEDWRMDSSTRARDLANRMSGEEIAPYLTNGGWGTFTTDESSFLSEDNAGYAYILGGGRAGVTRNAGSTVEANVNHAIWVNMIQELCESLDYGIPALVCIDPNGQSGLIACQSLGATMDPEIAVEVGNAYSEQYRAMGISMLLGPQVDLMGTPSMARGDGTYSEDPALTRDIAEGFVSGLQSTWAEDGTDLGWGSNSVMAVMKHYSGAGASEGGRDDHYETYAVFPNNNFEAHLIPFHDGAFKLTHSSTGSAAGIMTNYGISYSTDGSLGELVAGAFCEWKYDTLFSSGWTGLIVSDWGVISRSCWGMEDYTEAERIAIVFELGMTQLGGYSNMETLAEAWTILVDDLGEEKALELMRDRAYENLKVTFDLDLFENPYNSIEKVKELNWSEASQAYALETQLDSIIMLKNDGTIKPAMEGEKPTAYIPYNFDEAVAGTFGRPDTPAGWSPSVDLDIAAKYYNIVTDTVSEPSGVDGDGKAIYTKDDVIRASAAEVAACDVILVGMTAPFTASSNVTDDEGNTIYTPASIQYAEYTATAAREESIAGDKIITQFNDGYTVQTVETKENRSYKNQTAAQAANYGHLETLQHVASIAGDIPVIVMMKQARGSMVWSEVEPLADAILTAYSGVTDEALIMTAAGQHEPNGLLVVQMPASMDAVETQAGEDVPRDVECYVDADGNTYDFAFGMNWSGVINDQRVKTYSAVPLTECVSIDFQYAK